jgi:hypothetical protein
MLVADPTGAAVYFSVINHFTSSAVPSWYCAPANQVPSRLELYKASPTTLQFGAAVSTGPTAGLHAETVLENGRVYTASCPYNGSWPILQYYDPVSNATSPYRYINPGLSCDTLPNAPAPAPRSDDLGSIGLSRVGSMQDVDRVRLSWPHHIGNNRLAIEIQPVTISGPIGNPTISNDGSRTEIVSRFASGSIVQASVIQTDHNEIPPGSRLDDTLYYWQDSVGAYPNFGPQVDVFAMPFRDSGSAFPLSWSWANPLKSSAGGFQRDGDYVQGTSFFNLTNRSMNFVPIWSEAQVLASNVVTYGPEEVFYPFEDLGGVYRSGIAASSWGPSRIDVFGLGTDYALYHSSYDLSVGWGCCDRFPPPPGLTITSDPAVVSWADGRIDIVVRASDNAVWHMAYDRSSFGWSGWDSLGGYVVSGPGIASWGPGRLDVFALGGDNALYHKSYDWSYQWSNWERLGGYLAYAPAAVSWGPGRIDIFAVDGNDYQMRHMSYDWSHGWSGLEPQDGYFTSRPTVASWVSGRLDVFAVGSGGLVYHKSWDGSGSGWSSWLSVADTATSYAPGAISWRPGSQRIDLFTVGTTGQSLRHTSNIH